VGRVSSAESPTRSIQIYTCKHQESLHTFLSARLSPSPQTLVVSTSPESWALSLSGPRSQSINPSNCNIKTLFPPNRIKISGPEQCLQTLRGEQVYQQILLDGASPALFYEPKIPSTFAMLASLLANTNADLILSLVAPDPEFIDKFIHNIPPFRRDLGCLVACWLVAQGDIPIRYLRFSETALGCFSEGKQTFSPEIIFPIIKSSARVHGKPLIEVTKP
jgi:hypothetical protein